MYFLFYSKYARPSNVTTWRAPDHRGYEKQASKRVLDVEECWLAWLEAADTVRQVTLDSHGSLLLLEDASSPSLAAPVAHTTDRRYFLAECGAPSFEKKACTVCGNKLYQSTEPNMNKQLPVLQKIQRIWQFVREAKDVFNENNSSDSELAYVFEKVEEHLHCTEDSRKKEKYNSRINEDSDYKMSKVFISNAPSYASAHAVSEKLLGRLTAKTFEGVMFDTDGTRARS